MGLRKIHWIQRQCSHDETVVHEPLRTSQHIFNHFTFSKKTSGLRELHRCMQPDLAHESKSHLADHLDNHMVINEILGCVAERVQLTTNFNRLWTCLLAITTGLRRVLNARLHWICRSKISVLVQNENNSSSFANSFVRSNYFVSSIVQCAIILCIFDMGFQPHSLAVYWNAFTKRQVLTCTSTLAITNLLTEQSIKKKSVLNSIQLFTFLSFDLLKSIHSSLNITLHLSSSFLMDRENILFR